MNPFAAHQRDVNAAALASLRQLDTVTADLRLRAEGETERIDEVVRRIDAIQAESSLQTGRGIYLSMAELSRRYRVSDTSAVGRPLTEFELRSFSQHGEDGVIAEILIRIGIHSSFFVEFGIETGREGNCVFLADVMDWTGLFIESDLSFYEALARKYAADERVTTLNATITPANVEEVLREAGVPPEPDVLSVDVDGQDYWIWEAVRDYAPRLVVIEYNSLLPPGRLLAQPRDHAEPWDGTDYFGASLDALCALASRKGYRLVHTDLSACNAFFVRDDIASERFPPPGDVPRRHDPNYYMRGYHHPADPHGRQYADLADEP